MSKLITLLNDSSGKFKKQAFVTLAGPLRVAIWNWITHFPHQFINLCKNAASLPGNPLSLFETIEGWANSGRDKKSRRILAWPVLTMLILLCPEVLSTVSMAIKQQGQKNQKDDHRKKVMKI